MTSTFLVYEDDHGSVVTEDALPKLNAAKNIAFEQRSCEYMRFLITFLLLYSAEGSPVPDVGINKYPDSRTRVEFFYSIVSAV